MDLNALMGLMNAQINEDARRAGVMTLGALREALSPLPPETPVVFDDGGSPGDAGSYRGYYERLALEPTNRPTTAAEVIATLNRADGQTFHGYKGGEYEMDAYTFLHAAPYGDCGPCIVGVQVTSDHAVIETKDEEF